MIQALRHLPSTLNLLPYWRERKWTQIDKSAYANAWHQYGGSVMTHPEIVEKLSELADIPIRYLGVDRHGECRAAIATWGRHLALSRRALKRYKRRDCFDLGNAETILPIAPGEKIAVRFDARYLSALHQGVITNLRPQKESIALARQPEDYSKKFLYNQRRELRIFQEQGGEVRDVLNFSATELSEIYADLFQRRWGFPVPAKGHLPEVFSFLRPFMFGSVLLHAGRFVAIQVLYRVESPNWISVEYINGGVDPDYKAASPGSILTFLNTQSAWAQAHAAGKSLRYSFGRVDREYKMRWCNAVPVMRT